MNIKDQKDIFNIFHDGCVENIEDRSGNLLVTIGITYLANMLSMDFDNFFVELINCNTLSFLNWDDDILTKNIEEISRLEPEILSCDKEISDYSKIYCALSKVSGGILTIKTEKIKVYDANRNPVPIEKLDQICIKYWEDLRNTHT